MFFVLSGNGRARTRQATVLPLPVVQIEELLNSFVAKEKFEGDNQLECEECSRPPSPSFPSGKKVKVDGFRCNKICDAPKYLNVEIIRYEWVLDAVGRRKVQGKIDFPVDELDLAPYFCENSPQNNNPSGPSGAVTVSVGGAASSSVVEGTVSTNAADKDQSCNSSVDKGHDSEAELASSAMKYELVGMLLHHGATAGSGHYTAVLRVDTDAYDLIPDPSSNVAVAGEDVAAPLQEGQAVDGHQAEGDDVDKSRTR